MHFPGLDSQNYWKICTKSPPADQNLNFRTPGPFFNHALAFLPIPSPPKYRSQPEISISSPDSSNDFIAYQKVSTNLPNPDVPRFTNKKPEIINRTQQMIPEYDWAPPANCPKH